MDTIDVYPEKWEENLPEDVKEKLDKGLISKKEAEIMSRFHSEAARNQILYECREIEKRYRKEMEKQFRHKVKDAIRDAVFKMATQARENGLKTLTIPDEDIESEIKEWVKVFMTPPPLESEGERCPAYIRDVEKEWEQTIRRWMKKAIKEGIEKEKEEYIKKVWSQ